MVRLPQIDTLEVKIAIVPKKEGLVDLSAEIDLGEGQVFMAKNTLSVKDSDIGEAVYTEINRVANMYGYEILSQTASGYSIRRIPE